MQRKSVEPYLSTYLHTKGARLGLPISGNFELTARCNFNCPMCYVHLTEEQVRERGRELTTEEWINIAEAAKEKGMVFALLTGGEPFVRKDFFDIYEAIKNMGILVSINSNGSMISGTIRERIIDNPPSRINISLYGGQNETYQKMCGQPVFSKVIENIRALKEGGVNVSINLSITQYNCHDLEKIYNITKELDINVRATGYMYPPVRIKEGHFGTNQRLSSSEVAAIMAKWDRLRFDKDEFMQRAENMKKMIAHEVADCPLDAEGTGVRCRAGSSSFWMTWDGKMMPCGMFTKPIAYPLEVGFDKAWEQIREETKKIKLPSKCSSCAKKEICSVCAAVCLTETGRFDGVPEYVCEYTDKQVDYLWKESLKIL